MVKGGKNIIYMAERRNRINAKGGRRVYFVIIILEVLDFGERREREWGGGGQEHRN